MNKSLTILLSLSMVLLLTAPLTAGELGGFFDDDAVEAWLTDNIEDNELHEPTIVAPQGLKP